MLKNNLLLISFKKYVETLEIWLTNSLSLFKGSFQKLNMDEKYKFSRFNHTDHKIFHKIRY